MTLVKSARIPLGCKTLIGVWRDAFRYYVWILTILSIRVLGSEITGGILVRCVCC